MLFPQMATSYVLTAEAWVVSVPVSFMANQGQSTTSTSLPAPAARTLSTGHERHWADLESRMAERLPTATAPDGSALTSVGTDETPSVQPLPNVCGRDAQRL
ncbi:MULTISPECIES: hypothetical protein [Micromonospora]|uniref:hypothetical protein n=1 Tax=Micromonospora TaxID=1873 RepID=UPI00248AE6CB|nr:hypothetical protein [Micromonospora sp. WMMC264]WBB84490.1 hypothetical protein O7542_24625 [Micromonospora sp. WMMC264]